MEPGPRTEPAHLTLSGPAAPASTGFLSTSESPHPKAHGLVPLYIYPPGGLAAHHARDLGVSVRGAQASVFLSSPVVPKWGPGWALSPSAQTLHLGPVPWPPACCAIGAVSPGESVTAGPGGTAQ